jgi:hypothetical protein
LVSSEKVPVTLNNSDQITVIRDANKSEVGREQVFVTVYDGGWDDSGIFLIIKLSGCSYKAKVKGDYIFIGALAKHGTSVRYLGKLSQPDLPQSHVAVATAS